MHTNTNICSKKSLVTAMALALGTAAVPHTAAAKEYTFEWSGFFIMLDSGGACLSNSSLSSKSNQCNTPITGTLVYDDVAQTGSMTIGDFNFFSNAPSAPAQAQSISLEYIGDGSGGAGTLMLSNMLFNWNGSNGIPVSVVFDADGFIGTDGVLDTRAVNDVITGVGAVPASDGTYYNATYGYLNLGPIPLATTAWNTSFAAGCTTGSCTGVNPSGQLPLIMDTEPNLAYDTANVGGTIGGNPMASGPFQGSNATFAVTSMTVKNNDEGPTFTEPADVNQNTTSLPGDSVSVDLGTVTDEAAPVGDPTCNVAVEYSTDGGMNWIADDDGTNTINVTLTGTTTTQTIDWRATTTANDPGTCVASTETLATQTVTITITDATAPTLTIPSNFSVSVASTPATVTFEGPTSTRGTVAATDAVDSAPVIEWRLGATGDWIEDTPGVDESSANFVSGTNIVYWRATDASGNVTNLQQTVTVNLPSGIVGQPCTVDTELLSTSIGERLLEGTFIMRDRNGNLMNDPDNEVIGTIDTSAVCADESCTTAGATLESPKTFYGKLWETSTIRLFDQPGTYSFETCLNDGSENCTAPAPLTMTVNANQLGAHMLFKWGVVQKIDVAVVWDYSCGTAQLVSTDPDGDGVIGTKMVDGPFAGSNAAFDLKTKAGERRITNGGYTTSVPAVNNPTPGSSPLPISAGSMGSTLGGVSFTAAQLKGEGAADDSRVVESCVGNCFDFSVSGRTPGETIQVVLPLSKKIPWYSLYRKYDAGSNSWKAFVTNDKDSVKTAPKTDGMCPEPGAGDYTTYSNGVLAGMLRPNDQCVQLTITDNGPNDDDPADGVIADPSGVGVTSGPTTPTTQTSDGGGGGCTLSTTPASQRFDLWLLAGLMALFGLRRKLQK